MRGARQEDARCKLGPGLGLDLDLQGKKREGEGKVAMEIRERIKRLGMSTRERETWSSKAPGSGLLSLFIILSKKRSSIGTRSWDPRKRGEIAGVA